MISTTDGEGDAPRIGLVGKGDGLAGSDPGDSESSSLGRERDGDEEEPDAPGKRSMLSGFGNGTTFVGSKSRCGILRRCSSKAELERMATMAAAAPLPAWRP